MSSSASTGAVKDGGSPLDAYEVIGTIGKGSFGNVSKIRRKADGRILVWKELNYGCMRDKEKQLIVSEVNILRELRHPFIVRYYDRVIDKSSSRIFIVMEYCEGGDLGYLVKKAKTEGVAIDEEFIWRVFTQIVIALKECHRHKDSTGKVAPILHRDIKPGNIFMDAAQNIKIGDFGLAKELTSESKFATTNVGTPFYMSPEMINEMKYNEKSDIWALGCLLYELCALVPPFDACNHVTLAVKINAGKFDRIPVKYSEDLHRAIRWMLSLESAKRPSIEELEKIPKIRAMSREANVIVKEYSLNHQQVSKMREWKLKEEELARREATLAGAERALREKEAAYTARMAELQKREAALNERLGTLADDENRRYSMGDRPRTSSFSAQPGSGAPPPIPMLRAHSMGDVLLQGPTPLASASGDALKRVKSFGGHFNVASSTPTPTLDSVMTPGATAPALGHESFAASYDTSRPSTAGSTSSTSSSLGSIGGFLAGSNGTSDDVDMSRGAGSHTPSGYYGGLSVRAAQPTNSAFAIGSSSIAGKVTVQASSEVSRGVVRGVGGI